MDVLLTGEKRTHGPQGNTHGPHGTAHGLKGSLYGPKGYAHRQKDALIEAETAFAGEKLALVSELATT